eukprot:EST42709.1 Alpha/beta hydrolase family protein [Spironucleus salmonicida]
MVHGVAGTRNSIFFRQIPFQSQFATVRFDFLGQGRSEGEIYFSYSYLVQQLEELLTDKIFQEYTEKIFIGHSKGATVSMFVAKKYETVIAIAPRFFLNQFYGMTQTQIQEIRLGKTLFPIFGGKKIKFSKQDLIELENYDLHQLLSLKMLKLIVIGGKNDDIASYDHIQEYQQYGQIYYYDYGHFDFEIDCLNQLTYILGIN